MDKYFPEDEEVDAGISAAHVDSSGAFAVCLSLSLYVSSLFLMLAYSSSTATCLPLRAGLVLVEHNKCTARSFCQSLSRSLFSIGLQRFLVTPYVLILNAFSILSALHCRFMIPACISRKPCAHRPSNFNYILQLPIRSAKCLAEQSNRFFWVWKVVTRGPTAETCLFLAPWLVNIWRGSVSFVVNERRKVIQTWGVQRTFLFSALYGKNNEASLRIGSLRTRTNERSTIGLGKVSTKPVNEVIDRRIPKPTLKYTVVLNFQCKIESAYYISVSAMTRLSRVIPNPSQLLFATPNCSEFWHARCVLKLQPSICHENYIIFMGFSNAFIQYIVMLSLEVCISSSPVCMSLLYLLSTSV